MGILGLFLLWPLLEIGGFVIIGRYLGVGGTLAFVIGSAIFGMALLRRAGIGTLLRLRAATIRGEAQAPTAFDGACRIMAAILITVPGFLSGAAGFLLLVPAVRHWAVRAMARRLIVAEPAPSGRPKIIDAEFTELPNDPTHLPPQD
jgi:UPF0716 protein FxsA